MDETQLIIKKHSAMIQINVKELTLTQRKIINCLIYIAQKTGKQEYYTTTISSLKDMCRIGKTENIDLKEQLKKLKRIDIEFNYLNKDKNEVWELISLLSEVKIIPNEGSISFAFPPSLMDRVIKPQIYAPLDLILVSGLKSSYAIVLYEFLRDYLTAPSVPRLSIKEIRDLLGISEGEYRLFQNFKVKVLDTAVFEVNKKTDINCHYQLIKEYGNKNSHIQFFAAKKHIVPAIESLVDRGAIEETLDLFENNPKEEILQIPIAVLNTIPEKQRTETILRLINEYIARGNDYIISNIKYSAKKSKDNFPLYLQKALDGDYARHEREVDVKQRKKEDARRKKDDDYSRQLSDNQLKKLSEKDHEKLRERAIKELQAQNPDNPFAKRDVVIQAKMLEIYNREHESMAYSNSDQD